jgi:hypothetical protein
MLPDSEHDSSGFERDDADGSYARSAFADRHRDARLMATGALEMLPSASKPDAQAATSRDEEIARRALCAGFPVPRWCASVRLTMWSNRSRARVALSAVASSGLRPSRGFSNWLRP